MSNKRIAKNTIILYFRMILTMSVSLYTMRVILNTLGVIDYGIYNVVCGIVIMFSFLSGTLSSASQRFFSFELGRKNYIRLQQIFSLTVSIYTIIAIIIFVLAETVGLWFLNEHIVIPSNRIIAANWIYQFSILSFMVTLLAIPYNAAIIANENMNIFAYISIIEVILKLVIVYLLVFFDLDKLKLYSFLMFISSCIVSLFYYIISIRKYEECKLKFYWNRTLFNDLLCYSGWNLFGVTASILNNQGINILLNLFFGPVVNTARAIAYQINNVVNQFVNNFFTAVNPQITKYYAMDEKLQMMNLIHKSSKFAFFLLLLISLPVVVDTNFLLILWLKIVPENVILFIRFAILISLIDSLSNSLVTSALATGKIKKYQIVVGGVLLLNLPTSYCFLKFGFPPQITMYIALIISIICLFLRLFMLKYMINLSIIQFYRNVLFPVILVSIGSYVIPIGIYINLEPSFLRFILISFLGLFSSSITIYFLGLTFSERFFINKTIQDKILKKYFVKLEI